MDNISQSLEAQLEGAKQRIEELEHKLQLMTDNANRTKETKQPIKIQFNRNLDAEKQNEEGREQVREATFKKTKIKKIFKIREKI